MLIIGFQTPQLDVRGSCDAIYNYAHYNEIILGNVSIILVPSTAVNEEEGADRFRKRFRIINYTALEEGISAGKCDILYTIKYGKNDGVFSRETPTIVHCVFDLSEPHGDVYIAVSQALAEKYRKSEYLPHIVNQRPALGENLRTELGIPESALVIGRHGGMDTFNLGFVHQTIARLVREREDIYFLFMNTPVFDRHPQIIHLARTSDPSLKDKFILTCDAGLEASTLGHSFGLSCAEMSVNNKPMMVYNGPVWNDSHIKILGGAGLYFKDKEEFYRLVAAFERGERGDLNCYREFAPEGVMEQFRSIISSLSKIK